jgi:tetratricopeptide (TPR) repeat protein
VTVGNEQTCIAEFLTAEGALEYYRRGDLDSAMAVIEAAIAKETDPNALCEALIAKALIRIQLRDFEGAAAALAQACPDDALPLIKGNYFGTRAYGYQESKKPDAAIVDYEGANYWFQIAGDIERQARAQNNLALLHAQAGNFEHAHKCVQAARVVFADVGDKDRLGKAQDSAAQIYLMEGRLDEAERAALAAIDELKDTERTLWLDEAYNTLDQIEYKRIDRTLSASHPDLERLCAARQRIAKALKKSAEIDLVKRALDLHGGSVTRAAKELGYLTHASLIKMIKKHPELSSHRATKRKKGVLVK